MNFKKTFGLLATVSVVAAAGWNYQQSKQYENLSELALANVEALATGEDDCHYTNGVTNIQKNPSMWHTTLHHYYDCCGVQVDGYNYDSQCK